MNATQDSLAESHPALPGSVGLIRRAVAAYARASRLDDRRVEDVTLAVSEAVTNVVLHAYPTAPGEVRVMAQVVDDGLWVYVADDGCGYNVASQQPGLGWGLALITDACDEFTLAERAQGGTEARMQFLFAPPELRHEDR